MNIGMLWFDNDPKHDLSIKVNLAAEYYQKKYGKRPDLCCVNPSMVDSSKVAIEVRPLKTVLPNHLWIGVNQP